MPTLRAVAGGARPVFGRSAALKGQGEALIVVRGLPDSKPSCGRLEVGEAVPAPELLLIDAVAPLDFAVLLRASGPDVAMPDPSGFDPQHEGEGELLPVVTLQPLDGEGERPLALGEEGEARAGMQPPVEPQDPEARTVVQGRVLKRPAARDLHVLDVDLDRLSRFRPSRTASSGGVPACGSAAGGAVRGRETRVESCPWPAARRARAAARAAYEQPHSRGPDGPGESARWPRGTPAAPGVEDRQAPVPQRPRAATASATAESSEH